MKYVIKILVKVKTSAPESGTPGKDGSELFRKFTLGQFHYPKIDRTKILHLLVSFRPLDPFP